MKRISVNSSHIEHFFPKEQFRDRDLSYDNLFSSCNGEGTDIISREAEERQSKLQKCMITAFMYPFVKQL